MLNSYSEGLGVGFRAFPFRGINSTSSGGFDFSSISGYIHHFDFTDDTYKTEENGKIRAWADKAGNLGLEQTNTNVQPTQTTEKGLIQGTSDFMRFVGNVAVSGHFHTFMVLEADVTGWGINNLRSLMGGGLRFRNDGGGRSIVDSQDQTAWINSGTFFIDGVGYERSVLDTNGAVDAYFGEDVCVLRFIDTGAVLDYLFSDRGIGNRAFLGSIREFIVYDGTQISSAESDSVQAALTAKYPKKTRPNFDFNTFTDLTNWWDFLGNQALTTSEKLSYVGNLKTGSTNHLIQPNAAYRPLRGYDMGMVSADNNKFMQTAQDVSGDLVIFMVVRADTEVWSEYQVLLGDTNSVRYLGGAPGTRSILHTVGQHGQIAETRDNFYINGTKVDATAVNSIDLLSEYSVVRIEDPNMDFNLIAADRPSIGGHANRNWKGWCKAVLTVNGSISEANKLALENKLYEEYGIVT